MAQLIVKEDKSDKYPPRTYYNAKSSTTTLAIASDFTTAGEKLTRKAAGEEKYIHFKLISDFDTLKAARELYFKMKNDNSHTLNIAGNGIYTLFKHGFEQEDINNIVYKIIAQVHAFWPIDKIYTGGQSGADMAGAVTAYALNIDAEITLPKGFKQRFKDNIDINGTKESVTQQIIDGAQKLEPYTIYTKQSKKPSV